MNEIRRGNIFYADLNPFKGCEQGGIRPVLVIQNNKGNKNSPTTIIACITTKGRLKNHIEAIHYEIRDAASHGLKDGSVVLLEQLRTIDKCRLKEYVGKLNKLEMKSVNQKILKSLGMSRQYKYQRKEKRKHDKKD